LKKGGFNFFAEKSSSVRAGYFTMIQILDLLDYLDILYKTSGKNVSSGWAEITCPYPDCSDLSQHCGINLQSGIHHCWICGNKGNMVKLIMLLKNLSYWESKNIVEEFSSDIYSLPKEKITIPKTNILPKEATFTLPQLHQDYLIKRNFDPITIQRDYKIMACYTTGDYAYRIIIPIIISGRIVNFTTRDVTGQQFSKYKNCPNEIAIIPMKKCLYNIDTVKEKVIICEGVTDVWRIGKGSAATMGIEYTSSQLAFLSTKKLKKAYVLYDSDAINKAKKLAWAISTFCPKVEIIELEMGDPADLLEKEVLELRKEIKI